MTVDPFHDILKLANAQSVVPPLIHVRAASPQAMTPNATSAPSSNPG
jgi:hypothetical protein